MSDQLITVGSLLAPMIAHLAAAIFLRSRWTFTEVLVGAAVTVSGHITDAIVAAGHSRAWITDFWFVEHARWSWLALWAALLALLKQRFTPAVWHVIRDGPSRQRRRRYTLVERVSTKAPECRRHCNHTAKLNRPRFLNGQGWVCLAAVVERAGKVGAVPLMLRLVRASGNRGKLDLGRLMLRLLGDRLGRVRLLADAWYMRARLIRAALQRGHCVIGRVRSAGCARTSPSIWSRHGPGRGSAAGRASTAPACPRRWWRGCRSCAPRRFCTASVRPVRGGPLPDLLRRRPVPEGRAGPCGLDRAGTARSAHGAH